jgi:hypothetical protein
MNLIKFDHVSAWRIPDSCSGSFYGLDQNLAASWYAKNHGVPNLSPFNISFLSFSTKEKLMLPPQRRTTAWWHFQLWSPVAVGRNPQGAGEFERQILQSPKGFLCHFFRLLFANVVGIPLITTLYLYHFISIQTHLPRMVVQS